jgi:uncharacterized protein (DUF305 family)
MRKAQLLIVSLGLLAAAALATPSFANDPAPDPGAARMETEFLNGMVPHHRSAVAMAQVALDKATHQELKDMARNIIDDQTREVDEMTRWLHDWYGVEPPSGMMMPSPMLQGIMPMMHDRMPDMSVGMQDLQSLRGSEFETAFLSEMSHHHSMAVIMAAPVLMGGHHADLFTLAENVVISQGQEIRQMDEWLDAWYGIDRPLDRHMMSTGMPAQTENPMPMDMDHGH